MKIQNIIEGTSIGRYEIGDLVKTPFGAGVIVEQLGQDDRDTYFMVKLGDIAAKKYNLENRPYKFGSFEFQGIIKKGGPDAS